MKIEEKIVEWGEQVRLRLLAFEKNETQRH